MIQGLQLSMKFVQISSNLTRSLWKRKVQEKASCKANNKLPLHQKWAKRLSKIGH